MGVDSSRLRPYPLIGMLRGFLPGWGLGDLVRQQVKNRADEQCFEKQGVMHVIRGSKTGLERNLSVRCPSRPAILYMIFLRVYFCIGIQKQATSKWDLYIGLERLGFDSASKRNVGNVPDFPFDVPEPKFAHFQIDSSILSLCTCIRVV